MTADTAAYNLIKERFAREAEVLELMGGHDQIPELYAYFEEAGEVYLVEQWFDGPTLTEKVRQEGVCDSNYVRDFITCLLPAISHLHGNGIIHRDIKPDNIILRRPEGMPVLIDFGTVKDFDATVVSQPGGAVATQVISAGYTAPEQAAGFPENASDLFSLGMTVVFMLTGRRPTNLNIANGRVTWYPSVPNNLALDRHLVETIHKAIEPLAKARFHDAAEMKHALYSGTTKGRCQSWAPSVFTPYMWKAFGDFGLDGGLDFFDEALRLYSEDSGEYRRGATWRVNK